MLGGMDIAEAIRPGRQISAGLLGDVRRVVVQIQANHRFGWVTNIQFLEQLDKLAAAVPPFDPSRHVAILQIQAGENGGRA